MSEIKVYKVQLLPAQCAVDLGDGSERGEYVNQDYILQKLGRPHRNISLMYCYYPLDKGWPKRARDAFKHEKVNFQWDYPYDDYFPYQGGLSGNTQGEPFCYMKDIRRHGQDVTLTLTIDCAVSDEHLIQIAKDLKPYGRMQLRINHEATGNWFAFNKRYSYQEVADFFVRFHNIIKQEAPHIKTILCIDGVEENQTVLKYEKEFTEAIKVADYWSVDRYISLNFGWPFTVAERGGTSHFRRTIEQIINRDLASYERFKFVSGGIEKPMLLSEFNTDGDVTGVVMQAETIRKFYELISSGKVTCYSGIVFYQFRDRGRLGLEIEDPNNKEVGIEQPVLKVYKDIISEPFFNHKMEILEATNFPVKLRWGGAEDSQGLALEIVLKGQPVFFEASFEGHLNLMIKLNGKWFYKAPGVEKIDFMPAFYDKPISNEGILQMFIFAPPNDGINDPNQGDDWEINYYTTMSKIPTLRILYEPIEIE